jgi:DNA polymerase-2
MYPWLIYNHNISAETIISDKEPFERAPGIPVRVSLQQKGLVPMAIKPILDRRMQYKKNPTALNKERALGLKWVLVTSYGYLRFREFKLGMPSSHMAICAYAREALIGAAQLAEEKGFEVIHGIIDSLFIKKKGITEEEVGEFCKELEMQSGIPASHDGIYKWVVLNASVQNIARPLPSTYFGVFRNGEVKARGIELRRQSTPLIVKYFQQKALEAMAECSTKKEVKQKAAMLCQMLREAVSKMPQLEAKWLKCAITISKTDYAQNNSQKTAALALKKKGIRAVPGQIISFVHGRNKIVLPEDYNGKPDVEHYKELLIRALHNLLQQFGITKENIIEMAGEERQTKIKEFISIKQVSIPITKPYTDYAGLSERIIKKRLEAHGWKTWRAGLIGIETEEEIYPCIRRKYAQLRQLLAEKYELLHYLNRIHHGMPDYICYRNRVFKFVECKLGYERLSTKQKKCITKLQKAGHTVEVHRLVHEQTKTRLAIVNLQSWKKRVIERQEGL